MKKKFYEKNIVLIKYTIKSEIIVIRPENLEEPLIIISI